MAIAFVQTASKSLHHNGTNNNCKNRFIFTLNGTTVFAVSFAAFKPATETGIISTPLYISGFGNISGFGRIFPV